MKDMSDNFSKDIVDALDLVDKRLPFKPQLIGVGPDTIRRYNQLLSKYYLELAEYGISDEQYCFLIKKAGHEGQTALFELLQQRKEKMSIEK